MAEISIAREPVQSEAQSIYKDPKYVRFYDVGHYGGDFGSYIQTQEVEAFSSLITSGARLLDLGSGTGKLALSLSSEYETIVCADFSYQMLSVVKRKAAEEGIHVSLVLADAQHLCFRRDAFDTVVSSRLLMHLEDWRLGIAEISRVAKEAVVDIAPRMSLAGLSLMLRRKLARHGVIAHQPNAISLAKLRNEFKRHNRSAREWEKAYLFPIALHRKMNRSTISRWIEAPFRRLGITRLVGAPATLRASEGNE